MQNRVSFFFNECILFIFYKYTNDFLLIHYPITTKQKGFLSYSKVSNIVYVSTRIFHYIYK